MPPHLKTVYIAPVEDKSGSGELRLREIFRDRLIRKFQDDNTLLIAEKANADALVECTIVSFTDAASNIVSNQNNNASVSGKRITIGAKVLFKDLVKKKTMSEKSYSNNSDYLTNVANVQEKRIEAVESTIDRITDDILIGTVSNW
ncbi:MAG: LPS assembly lipoprotein LptE [Syntrophothermus sp.]